MTVNYDEGDGNVFLYVQDADSVYSVKITEDTIVALSDMTGINNLTDENTKIWLEKSEDNVAYAVMAEALLTEHIPNADDGDCTTAITCSSCGTVTTEAKENHIDDNGDGICDHCDSYAEPKQEDEYYQIANANNLMWFAAQVNEGKTTINAKLTADIDMKDIDWTIMSSFAGTFDGNGHTILYLCADENGGDDDIADGSRCGLFQTLSEGGIVTNLTISGAQLWSAHSAGAIAAVNNGTISKCIVKDSTIELGASHGLAAIAGTNTGTVTDCGVVNCFLQRRWGAANSSDYAIGVVVEDNSGTVSNCFSYGCTFNNSPNLYAIVESGNAPVNCYYYTGATVSDTVATAKTADQFASGEVAYLLNGSSSENVTWYQTLGEDSYPVLDSEHGKVYSVFKCNGTTPVYRNVNENEPHTDVNPVDGKCDVCGTTVHTHEWTYTVNGSTITAVCNVTGCPVVGEEKTIVISASDKIYDGTAVTATVTNNADTTDYSSSIVYKDSKGDVVDEAVNAGTYTANLTVGGVTAKVEFTIAKVTPAIGTVSASNMVNTLDVSQVVLSRTNETVPGTLSLAEGTTLQYGIHDYTYVFTPNDNTNYETVTETVSITISDTNAPTATYKVGTDGWKQFINAITFGHFCKDNTTVEITYGDEGSGVADKQYYVSEEEITNTENILWSDYTDTLKINATGKYYIYVRVTDNYGNVVIQNSEGIVVYEESVITPTSFSYEYGEENALNVNISANGNTFAKLTDGSGNEIATENYSIAGSTLTIKGEYLSDLDVGEYTYKICMNPQGVENTEVTLAYSFVVNVTAKELTVTGATAANRDYIANDKTVDITGVTLSGKQGTDDVSVEITGLKGTLSSANAGTYTSVTLPTLTLTGDDAENYFIAASAENVSLTTPVTISKAAAPTLSSGSKEYMYHQRFEGESVSITGLPTDCGEVEYVLLGVSGDMLEIVSIDANGKITYNVKALDSYTEGLQGTISVNVKMDNYNDAFYTLDVTRRDKYAVTVKDGMSVSLETNELTYGQMLGGLAFNEVTFVGEAGEEVTGTLRWENPSEVPGVATDKASWRFIPDSDAYKVVVGTLDITVHRAPLVVEAVPVVADRVYDPSVTLADVALSGGTVKDEYGNTIEGTWSWEDSGTVPTVVNDGYEAVFTPADANYETVTGTITVTVTKATPDIGTVSVLDDELENTTDISMVVLKRTDESMAGTLELTAEALLYGAHGYVWKFTPQDLNNYEELTGTVAIEVKDTIAPVASYKIGTGDWKSFGTSTTYETFSKERLSVEIKAEDSGSGIASVQYYVAPGEIPDVSYIPGWTDYTEAITLDIDRTHVIYVEVTDNGGNKVILNSEGIVIYEDSEITTPELTHTYKEEADEEAVLNLNANTFAKITDAEGTELVRNTDYIVTENSGTLSIEMQSEYLATLDAGEHTYYVSVNPQGVETTEVTLAYSFVVKVTAKELTVTEATATSRAYIANDKTVNITGITLSGIQGTDDVSVEITGLKGTLSSANAGTYTSVTLPTLTLTGDDTENYVLVQPTSAVATNVTINKLNPTITVGATEYYKTFGDADFTLDITDDNLEANVTYSSNDENVVTVSNGTVTIKGAGSTTITVSMGASTNYNAAVDKTVTVNVARATYSVDTINKSYLYARSNADSINLAELLPEDCGTVNYASVTYNGALTFTSEDTKPKVTNGILAYTLESGAADDTGNIIVDVETQNYEDITITVNVTLIDQIPVNVDGEVELNSNILTYGETLSGLTFKSVDFVDDAGNEVEGTLAWKEPSATPNAGTTSATWVFTPNNADYASVEGTVAITVNKATPNVTGVPTVADRVYNPSVVLADSDLTGGTVKGVDGNGLAGGWSWQSTNVVPVVNNSGYIAVFTPTDSTNYETVTRTITVNVTKATPYVATKPTASALTYGQTLNQSVLSNGVIHYSETDSTVVAGSFAWKDTTVKPAVADSDTTAFEVVFTPADSVNYKAVETTAKITVNKAEKAPNLPANVRNVPYSIKKVSEVLLPTGWEWQSGETALEVGVVCNAVAVYTGADAGNYETESVTIAITREACTHGGETELRGSVEESCTEAGYTGDTYCLICEEKLATGEAIPATGHKDADKNHVCDNGCNVAQGTCEDADKDHDCDYGCDKVHGICEDADKDHDCDYGCSKVFGTCEDADKDHDCDYGCDKAFGTHEAASGKHTCEYCGKAATSCKDDNHDHVCDICGEELEHSFLTEWKYDEDGHWHVCSCGLKKDEATHSFTSQVTKQPTVYAEGERTYTCSECEYSYKEPIEKVKETPTSAPNTTPIPTDSGKPFIQDDTGKIGWEAIRGETSKAKEGETIIVDMNGATSVPGAVFDDIKGKNITITLDMGTGVSWTINGKDITASKVNDINFEVKVGTKDNPINTIPVEVINKITGERYFVNISLTHDGELGLKAILNINLDKKNAGLFANLFYYNEKYERMQFIWADDIDEYGTAHLVFTHASEYSIVIDKNIMKDSTTVTSPRTADEERNMPTVLLISALLSLSAGYGCFYTAYRRRKRRR